MDRCTPESQSTISHTTMTYMLPADSKQNYLLLIDKIPSICVLKIDLMMVISELCHAH